VVISKRAVFFSISTIVLLAALMLLFKAEIYTGPLDTGTITVYTTNSFRERVENVYIPLVARHYSYRTLYALADNAYTNSRWLVLPDDFTSAMLTGEYEGSGATPLSLTNATYVHTTLQQAFDNLSNVSKEAGFNLTFYVHDVVIEQTGSFQAAVTINISYNLSSRDQAVRYERNVERSDKFTLVGLPELGYNREARSRGFNEYLYLNQYQPNRWNNTAFAYVIVNRTFMYNNNSPSYFQRLEGQWNAESPFGIEAVIPTSRTPAGNLTSFDWQYFSNDASNCIYALDAPYAGTHVNYEQIFAFNLTNTVLLPGVSQSNCPPAP
jgi:hypothetical protein